MSLVTLRPVRAAVLLFEKPKIRGFQRVVSASVVNDAAISWQHTFVTGVRIDKWLWAARFYKTRSLATKACELGRVQSAGQRVKAAREVHPGDKLCITNDTGDFAIVVLQLTEVRGPASVAQTLYHETEASREARLKAAAERKAMPPIDRPSGGRPSKRDRRHIIQFRGGS